MCGIYGFRARAGETLSTYESTVLATVLATGMESRGRDSWGGVIFTPDEKVTVHKGLGKVTASASEFLRAAANSQTILGHTRAATIGKVSRENAHPFVVGNILGVHNGSVYNWEDLNKRYKRSFEVDSTHIFAHIDDELPLSEVEGHGTFFYTKRNEGWHKIYLARTAGGSLYLARFYTDSKKNHPLVTVWASERYPVERAADLIGVYQTEVDIKPSKLYAIGQDGEIYDQNIDVNLKRSAVWTMGCGGVGKDNTPAGYWADYTADPFEANMVVIGGSTAQNPATCETCACAMFFHKYGMCDRNKQSICHSKLGNKCLTKKYKICRCCGHYLVYGIHEMEAGKIVCTDCKKECTVRVNQTTTLNPPQTNDDTTDDDEVSEGSSNILRFLSKSAKKKLAKKAKGKVQKRWCEATVAPLPQNIRAIDSVTKCYRNVAGMGTTTIAICPDCTCELTDHIWGWCTNSGSRPCKGNSSMCKSPVPLCTDCGHHMVETVHMEANIHPKAIWCAACSDFCASAVEDSETDEVTEVTDVPPFNEAEVID